MAVSSEYLVNIIISSKDKTSEGAKKATGALNDLQKAALKLALSYASLKTVQEAIKFVQFGAQVQRATNSLDLLGGAAGTNADAIVSAMQQASNFTIDKMTAMTSANKALLLNVAKTPEEFARLSEQAVLLGRAMGKDAASSIDDFITAAGRQSKMIADNLGLMVSAEDANKRYAASHGITVDAMDDAAKKQAFLQEMLRQAEEKTVALKNANLDLAGTFEQVGSLAKDMKTDVADLSASIVDLTMKQIQYFAGGEDQVSSLRQVWDEFIVFMEEGLPHVAVGAGYQTAVLYRQGFLPTWNETVETVEQSADVFRRAMKAAAYEPSGVGIGGLSDELATFEQTANEVSESVFVTSQMIDALSTASVDAVFGTTEFAAALGKSTGMSLINIDALREQRDLIVDTGKFALDASMRWTSYYQDVEEKAESFEERREKLDAAHLEKIADLQKRGWAKAIQIDAEAEQAKLAVMLERLDIALQSQAEFTDKTRESTRMRKDLEIATLQGQIADQQQMLEDYHAGRLTKAGENVNALITEEDRLHNAAVAGLEKEIAKTKELQRQQFGSLLMQTFETWAEINKVPPAKMLEMRTAIAEEYGLISSEEAQLIDLSIGTWDKWASNMYTNTEQTATQLGKDIEQVRLLQESLDGLPDVKVIEVMIKHSGSYNPYPEMVPIPEVVPGSFAVPPSTVTNNFNQTVNTQATTHAVMSDFHVAQALVQ